MQVADFIFTFGGLNEDSDLDNKCGSRRLGEVINCHREDQYSLSGRPRDEENVVGTDFIFLFKFSTLSANPNGFAVGENVNGKMTALRSINSSSRVCCSVRRRDCLQQW